MSGSIVVTLGKESEDFIMGGNYLSAILGAGGNDVSPRISWVTPDGVEAHSYAVTVYDPDAPTGSGFWHWGIFDIPSDCRGLEENAGDPSLTIAPAGAKHIRNDAGYKGYVGAAPPPGHGPHRYYFRVHALNVSALDIPEDASPAILGFNIWQHEIGRGEIVVTYEALP